MKQLKTNTNLRLKASVVLLIMLFCFSAVSFFAQTPPRSPSPHQPVSPKTKDWKAGKKIINESVSPAEKSITVDANVNISLCIESGNLKINGWRHNEVRAFVMDGSEVGFKVLQKSRQSSKPVWVMVLGFDPAKNTDGDTEECLSGEEIEIDVPRNATVNVKSRESMTTIDSVGRVAIENVSGGIFLNNITRGVEAKTYEGDVTVENSSGAMTLLSTTGNIVAFNVSSSEIGDIFKAKTSNGAIVLKDVEQRQIEVGSNSGSINFTGEFLSGGQYNFGTSNGSITLTIPQDSPSKITASYGYGAFKSDIPLQNIVKPTPTSAKVQNLTGQIGKGDATLNLTTYSGSLRIKKQ
jgi:hypothetical protein